jgi:hypothetical protein
VHPKLNLPTLHFAATTVEVLKRLKKKGKRRISEQNAAALLSGICGTTVDHPHVMR